MAAGRELDELYAAGRVAWPALEVDAARFAEAVRATPRMSDPAELYLACACATGDAAAIRAFEERHFGCVGAVVRRLGLPAGDADEVAQILRRRLFVGDEDGGPPAVVGYAGGGRIGGLVQVAATRIAINLRRGRRRFADEPPAEESAPIAAAPGGDTAYAKAEYRQHLRRALEESASALPPRDRALLRMHLVERASIEDVAAVFRVHRATAARWIQAARATLVEHSRDRFLALAQLDDADGLASFVESELTLSLDRILG